MSSAVNSAAHAQNSNSTTTVDGTGASNERIVFIRSLVSEWIEQAIAAFGEAREDGCAETNEPAASKEEGDGVEATEEQQQPPTNDSSSGNALASDEESQGQEEQHQAEEEDEEEEEEEASRESSLEFSSTKPPSEQEESPAEHEESAVPATTTAPLDDEQQQQQQEEQEHEQQHADPGDDDDHHDGEGTSILDALSPQLVHRYAAVIQAHGRAHLSDASVSRALTANAVGIARVLDAHWRALQSRCVLNVRVVRRASRSALLVQRFLRCLLADQLRRRLALFKSLGATDVQVRSLVANMLRLAETLREHPELVDVNQLQSSRNQEGGRHRQQHPQHTRSQHTEVQGASEEEGEHEATAADTTTTKTRGDKKKGSHLKQWRRQLATSIGTKEHDSIEEVHRVGRHSYSPLLSHGSAAGEPVVRVKPEHEAFNRNNNVGFHKSINSDKPPQHQQRRPQSSLLPRRRIGDIIASRPTAGGGGKSQNASSPWNGGFDSATTTASTQQQQQQQRRRPNTAGPVSGHNGSKGVDADAAADPSSVDDPFAAFVAQRRDSTASGGGVAPSPIRQSAQYDNYTSGSMASDGDILYPWQNPFMQRPRSDGDESSDDPFSQSKSKRRQRLESAAAAAALAPSNVTPCEGAGRRQGDIAHLHSLLLNNVAGKTTSTANGGQSPATRVADNANSRSRKPEAQQGRTKGNCISQTVYLREMNKLLAQSADVYHAARDQPIDVVRKTQRLVGLCQGSEDGSVPAMERHRLQALGSHTKQKQHKYPQHQCVDDRGEDEDQEVSYDAATARALYPHEDPNRRRNMHTRAAEELHDIMQFMHRDVQALAAYDEEQETTATTGTSASIVVEQKEEGEANVLDSDERTQSEHQHHPSHHHSHRESTTTAATAGATTTASERNRHLSPQQQQQQQQARHHRHRVVRSLHGDIARYDRDVDRYYTVPSHAEQQQQPGREEEEVSVASWLLCCPFFW